MVKPFPNGWFLVLTTLLLVNPQFSSQFHRRDVWRSVGSSRGFVGSPRKFTTCVLWYTKRAAAPAADPWIVPVMWRRYAEQHTECGHQFRVADGGVSGRRHKHVCPRCTTQVLSRKSSGRIRITHNTPQGRTCPCECWHSDATHLNSASRHLLSSLE